MNNSRIQNIIDFFQDEISLIWIIFGTVGNLISLIVLCMPKMRRHSTFTYLIFLSMCDTFVLYFGLLRDYLVSKYKYEIRGDLVCKLHVFLFYFVLHMASWLLVAVNIDRLIAVTFLSLSKKWCTPQVAMLVSLFLAISLAVINIHLIFFIDSDLEKSFINEITNSNNNINYNNKSLIFNNDSLKLLFDDGIKSMPVNPYVYQRCLIKSNYPYYNYFFKHIFTWIDTSLQVILPFIIMLICNMNVIHQVLFTRRNSKGKNLKRLKKMKGMCYMIVSLSILFFILEAPVLIFICIMQEDWMEDPFTQLFWTIINLMMYTNHVINFFSYCMTGTKFRRELIRLFIPNVIATHFNFNRYLSTKQINHTNMNHLNNNNNNKRIIIEKKDQNRILKNKKKNLKVNFEDLSKHQATIVNVNNTNLDELSFILTKIRDVESNKSFDNVSDLQIKKKRSSLSEKISLKLRNLSKRKSKTSLTVSNRSIKSYDDIDIENDEDEDVC
jgi:hypothetical protein